MASTAAAALLSPPPVDTKLTSRAQAPATHHSIGLPSLPPPPQFASVQTRESWKTAAYCRRFARNTVSRVTTREAPAAEIATETPEIVKTVQEAWDKLEDKYAVVSLGAAGFLALWASGGMISAIDRLPLVPGVLELVGIGYSGWFVYRYLLYKPDREALIAKIKSTYSEIIGSS